MVSLRSLTCFKAFLLPVCGHDINIHGTTLNTTNMSLTDFVDQLSASEEYPVNLKRHVTCIERDIAGKNKELCYSKTSATGNALCLVSFL